MAFIIAVASLYLSHLMAGSFTVSDFGFYVTLSLLDLCFLYIVSVTTMLNLKRRWMSCVLSINIVGSLLSSVVLYLYEYMHVSAFNYLAINVVDAYFTSFSVVASVLLILISLTPKRILHVFDNRFWPDSLSDVYSCDIGSCTENTPESVQK